MLSTKAIRRRSRVAVYAETLRRMAIELRGCDFPLAAARFDDQARRLELDLISLERKTRILGGDTCVE